MPKDKNEVEVISSNIKELKKEQDILVRSVNDLKSEEEKEQKKIKEVVENEKKANSKLKEINTEIGQANDLINSLNSKAEEAEEAKSKASMDLKDVEAQIKEKKKIYNATKNDFYAQSQNEVDRMNKIKKELGEDIKKGTATLEITNRDVGAGEKKIKNNRENVSEQEKNLKVLDKEKGDTEIIVAENNDALKVVQSDIVKEKESFKEEQNKKNKIKKEIRELVDDKGKVEKNKVKAEKDTEVAEKKLEDTIKKEKNVFALKDYLKRMETYVKKEYDKVGMPYQPFKG